MSSFKSGNPALTDARLQAIYNERIPERAQSLTIEGVMNKTTLLTAITCVTGLLSALALHTGLVSASTFLVGSLIISLFTFVLGLIICFKPECAQYLSHVYADCEGITLGFITAIFEMEFPGIGTQALILTFAITFGCLTIYRSNIIKDEYINGKVVMIGLFALIFSYIIGFLMKLAGFDYCAILDGNPLLSIIISVIIIAFFSYVLLNDFKTVRQAARQNMPQYMEWYFAFSILLTLINIYIEVLRLLYKLRDR